MAKTTQTIRLVEPDQVNPFTTPLDVALPPTGGNSTMREDGVLQIENPDGSLTFDLAPEQEPDDDDNDFYANLAAKIDKAELDRISAELLDGIESDNRSRSDWLETRARGIKLLGLKLNEPKADADSEGVSQIIHPLLLEASLRFQANARGELLPASGPVKIRNDHNPKPKLSPAPPPPMLPAPMMGHNGGPPMGGPPPGLPAPMPAGPPPGPPGAPPGIPSMNPQPPNDLVAPPMPAVPPQAKMMEDEIAEAFENDMNYYLTAVATEYYPDTDKMLFWVGAGGQGIKKVYNCPIRRRPVSESVDAEDIIVSNAETNLENCGRITHRIKMRPSVLKRMQLIGAYLDVDIPTAPASIQTNAVEEQKANIQGVNREPQKPQDAEHEIYECYCELNIKGYEHRKGKKQTGLQLPYIVTIHKDSRQVLQVRRNWREDDKMCLAKEFFVDFPFDKVLGFYGIGLIHILGNTTTALTAAWRVILDAGMFGNFPGFIYAKQYGKQLTNQFRVAPGSGVPLEAFGDDIRKAVMPLPYKEAGPGFINFITHMAEVGGRLGATAEINIGEGKQDAPVGTTLALIEQATKMMDAVHKRLHQSQAKEFQLLKERFKEDPEAFWRFNNKPTKPWDRESFRAALDDLRMVPVADPNNPTSMHRIAKAVVIKTLAAASPQLYDPIAVDTRIMNIAGIDPEGLFKQTPSAPDKNPSLIAAEAKAKSLQDQMQSQLLQMQMKQQIAAMQSVDKAADRASRERIERMKILLQRLQIVEGQIIHGSELDGNEMREATSLLLEHIRETQNSDRDYDMSLQKHDLEVERDYEDAQARRNADRDKMELDKRRREAEHEDSRLATHADISNKNRMTDTKIETEKKLADAKAQAAIIKAKKTPAAKPSSGK